MKVKVIRISKLSIYFFIRVEAKPPLKFGESTFETMPKDASREIEKTPKYFIKSARSESQSFAIHARFLIENLKK